MCTSLRATQLLVSWPMKNPARPALQYGDCAHVILPPEMAQSVPKTHLMTETEWRNLGVQQSLGWEHYMVHSPEPHVLLFRRPTKAM
nr:cyclin-dependent kinases regulatory subunit-like isoform X3 [Dermacentor andersoni]